MLLCGASGCGKTNALLNMILTDFIYFDKLYLYAKNIQQDKYRYLIDKIHKIEKSNGLPKNSMIYACSKIDDIIVLTDDEEDEDDNEDKPNGLKEQRMKANQEMVKVKEKMKGKGKETKKIGITAKEARKKGKSNGESLDPELQNLVVFDDFVSEKQQHIIQNYFVGSRHRNCSCIYLSQSYYDTPYIIRKNCTHFAIWEVASDRELMELAKDHASSLGSERFKDLFHQCTQYPYHFMFIDKVTKGRPDLRYRVNFGRVPIGEKEEEQEAVAESSSEDEE